MSTTTFPTTVDGVLDRAADLIETHGLCQGHYAMTSATVDAKPVTQINGHQYDGGPLCAQGAIYLAATGRPTPSGCPGQRLASDTSWVLEEFVIRFGTGQVLISQWNDHPGRTADEVCSVLSDCAQDYRDGAR